MRVPFLLFLLKVPLLGFEMGGALFFFDSVRIFTFSLFLKAKAFLQKTKRRTTTATTTPGVSSPL